MPITASSPTAGTRPSHGFSGPPRVLAGAELCYERTGLPQHDWQRPGQVRRITRAHLGLWNLRHLSDVVESVASEVVANAFLHGVGEEVTVRFFRTEDDVRLEVSGGGQAHIPPADPLAEHGRGLVLVDALTDAWGVSEDGSTTWCSFRHAA